MNKLLIVFLIFIAASCSSSSKDKTKRITPLSGAQYVYTDKNGKYLVRQSSQISKKENTFTLKKSIEIPGKDKDSALEQSVTISEFGSVKKINLMRPKISQYTVWFEGKKYFSELKVNPKKKNIEVRMQSPESQWNGTKTINFPSTKMVTCFYSQLYDCVKDTGFFEIALKKAKARMNILVIWEGYPYLNETYSDFPSELFSKGELEFDGKLNDDEFRFNLSIAGQSIVYIINRQMEFMKMFWISQGISMVDKRFAKTMNTSGEESE